MHRGRLIRLAVAGLALPTMLAAPAVAASADTAPSSPTSAAGAVATYTLITGDRVSVTSAPDGRPIVRLVGGGDAAAFQVLASGSHLYVIPEDAAGYIGQPLALDLFDVTTMQPSSASQPALAVDYAAGAAPALPAGLKHSGAGALAVTNAAAFGHALHTAWLSQLAGHPDDLFAGITAIRPAIGPASAPMASPPPGALYTVRVKAFDRRGQRVASGDLVAANTDDVNRYLADQSFFRGEVAFSVPAGHYSFSSYIATLEPDKTVDWTLAAAPDVSITRDTTVILDARKATPVTADTPRPSTAAVEELNYQRNSAAGDNFGSSFTTFGPDPLYATPTPAVETGQLYFFPYFRLVDPDNVPSDYVYDLESAYAGAIPDDLAHTYGPDELATEQATYHSAAPGRSEFEERDGFATWQALSVGAGSVLAAPSSRTEYVSARPDLFWLHSIATDADSSGGETMDGLRVYAPGEQRAVNWLGQPMAAGIEQEPSAGQTCPVCRSGDTLATQLFPYTDAAGQFQLPDPTTTEHLALYNGDQQLGDSASGRASFPLSSDPATYRLVYDVSRDAPWWPTSTSVHTEWTFPSAERAPDPLPAGWSCAGKGGGKGGGGSGGGGCSFEPLLFTQFTTSAGADDVIPAGSTATVDVTVFHQRGAAASPVTAFSAQVSFDGGASWKQVPATVQGDGLFRLRYPQPALAATDGFAALRIHAGDEDGSVIDQTILRAYPLSVTAPAQLPGQPGSHSPQACPDAVAAPFVQCQAVVNTAAGVSLDAPVGLGPDDLASAYHLPAGAGAGTTVAIVDAFDDPNAEADLAAYRAEFGLPACTSAGGCFRKVGQDGSPDNLPAPDPGWGLEISLDLDAVSATCPACHILLVEGNSPSLADLIPAVLTAARLGAGVISNSYGSRGEFSGEQTLERYYRNLKVPFVVATGDYGYGNGALLIGGVAYPAASRYAIAVGGTSLSRDDSARGWAETAWDGATSGCSAYINKPGWQKDKLCGMRAVADISAVADPQTGLAVYDTFGYDGWLQVGGTSLAAPVISAAYAMGPAPQQPYASGLYHASTGFFDIVGGSNGDCQDTYLCTAVPGYDGPTGLGSPDGTGAL